MKLTTRVVAARHAWGRAPLEDGCWGWKLGFDCPPNAPHSAREGEPPWADESSRSFSVGRALLLSLWLRVACSTWGIANARSSHGCRLYFTEAAPGRQVKDEPCGGRSPKCRATLWRRSRRCTSSCCFSTSVICTRAGSAESEIRTTAGWQG
jgi:hypothetical protein